MAALEVLALNTSVPRIEAPQTGDTYTMPRAAAITAGTVTTDVPALNVTQTWNAAGTTFTALKFNITDTASASGSLLMDLQVGGVSQFRVTKAGGIFTPQLSNTADQSSIAGTIFETDGNGPRIRFNGTNSSIANSGGVFLYSSSAALGVNSTLFGIGASSSTPDTILARDAADTLAQRRGTNAQTFRVYNTFTDASNYERGKMEWASNALRIGTENAGTGTQRQLEFQTAGATRVIISSSGSYVHFLTAGGGASTSFGRPADGVLTLGNFNADNFNRLQFGGTTSSFPALKRSSAALQVRLADDSANAALESASVKTNAPAGGTSGTWKLGVAATVSPTSPNRTIEVDIGGTIYYIHAKTTND